MFRRFHHIDQILEYGVPRETVVEVFPGNLANGGDFDLLRPTFTRGVFQIRTLAVTSPLLTRARSFFVKSMKARQSASASGCRASRREWSDPKEKISRL